MRRTLALLALAAALSMGALNALRAGEAATPVAAESNAELAVATFAAGCFWCVESDFDKVDGVVETISGFTGGHTKNPTYGEVGQGHTGHTEAVQLRYDPKKVSYEKLLDYYWHHVDLVDGEGQFCDRGNQYRPAIFTHSDEQKRLAEESKAALDKSGRFKQPIAVEITPASAFTPAEEYHQDYYKKNPLKYRYYRYSCRRDARIATLWGEMNAGH
jgi:methionine-S-sulfoxide reductase